MLLPVMGTKYINVFKYLIQLMYSNTLVNTFIIVGIYL